MDKILEVDASNWLTGTDPYYALFAVLKSPPGHGVNSNALVDSIVYGGMNEAEPPFVIRVNGLSKASGEASEEMMFISETVKEAIEYERRNQGNAPDVRFELLD